MDSNGDDWQTTMGWNWFQKTSAYKSYQIAKLGFQKVNTSQKILLENEMN